ncbi:high affinity copper uptake protein 1 isoform X1 [Plutella xylostella]|uniref:high affinity copper uptake protein 1 isoform X1 n=1 Tax=Plutella xylostella TaxID=51655 RepID=UPI00203299C9|nr:high affinity copper uptake protein 1 isoform X1 [Plutella xylostella]XP_037964449.2 high affinity copper uptake protein 1 isoform X1 [Plutella xylostella]
MDHMEHINHAAMNHSVHMGHGGHGTSVNTTHIHNMNDPMDHSLHLQASHDHSGSHAGHAMQHNMSMTFHGGYMETILFSWWSCHGVGEFIGSFLAIFIMALLYEGLKYYRKHLLWKTYAGLQYCAVSPSHKGVANVCSPDDPTVIQPVPHVLERNVPRMLSAAHVWQTGLHGVQVLVSYMLMLVFMTYNVWLCVAVVMGSATGYFLFGWRESVVVDFTEHCH